MRQVLRILRTRIRIANNYMPSLRDHLIVHLLVGIGVLAFLLVGGTVFFYSLFAFLDRQEDFGALLMNRLIGMVMMAFFSMLVFSNLIVTLSTTYISREVEYLIAQPVRHSSVFFVKMLESMFYSSWAFVILSLPLFTSFGVVRGVSPWFYPLVALLVLPFLAIPAALGSLLTMLLSAFLPARRALKWSVSLLALGILGGIAVLRQSGLRGLLLSGDMESFTEIMNVLRVGKVLWAPHYWVSQGMISLGERNFAEFAYWLAMLAATALMLLQVCAWLAPPLYYRGWCMAREGSGGRGPAPGPGRALFTWCEARLALLRPGDRALVMKDLRTFWRDPTQWTQLIILFGLLFIYIANLRSAYFQNMPLRTLIPGWRTVLAFFNMSATCFVISILTTRFVYPMLSLEGKQFWIVGLAPIDRSRVVWQKYWLCWTTSIVLTQSLMLFSNWMLGLEWRMYALSAITVFLMSFGLTSLAVGLGAATPSFKEDNPARIANGLGGTLNVILSLIYITLVIALQVTPAFLANTGRLARLDNPWVVLGPCLAAMILVHCAAIILPMHIGLARWRRMEIEGG